MGGFATAVAVEKIASTILHFVHIGGGCGSPCIDASKLEQVFEVAADYVHWWGNLGYLSKAEMTAGLNQLLKFGQQNLAGMGTDQARNGSRNMTNVINQLIGKPLNAPPSPTKAWERNAAIDAGAQHVTPSAGWYQDAYAKGQALSVQVVEQGILPQRPVTDTLKAELGSVTGGSSGHTLLIGAAALLAAKKILF